VIWYDFQDDGLDEKYNECNFGLIHLGELRAQGQLRGGEGVDGASERVRAFSGSYCRRRKGSPRLLLRVRAGREAGAGGARFFFYSGKAFTRYTAYHCGIARKRRPEPEVVGCRGLVFQRREADEFSPQTSESVPQL